MTVDSKLRWKAHVKKKRRTGNQIQEENMYWLGRDSNLKTSSTTNNCFTNKSLNQLELMKFSSEEPNRVTYFNLVKRIPKQSSKDHSHRTSLVHKKQAISTGIYK